MHAYNGVLTILGLACFFGFCVLCFCKVKLTVPLFCVCVHSAWKGRPRNDQYCVGWDLKPYSLTCKYVNVFIAEAIEQKGQCVCVCVWR